MLPTGIFGFFSRDTEDLQRSLLELQSSLGSEQRADHRLSADGHCLLGTVASTRYDYPATIGVDDHDGAIGVFDGFTFEPTALARDPQRMATMQQRQIDADANGMFLAAAYRDGLLRVLSDPWGTLPLYYGSSDDSVAFSTSLRLLRSWRARHGGLRVDESGRSQFLLFGLTLAGRTAIEGVRRIGRAEILDFDFRSTSVSLSRRTYYRPDTTPRSSPSLEADMVEAFHASTRTLLEQSPGPCLSALTGGMDSRSIAAAAHGQKRSPLFVTHHTREGHDIALAREVAGRLRARHHVETLPSRYVLDDGVADFMACSNGVAAYDNFHASDVHRRYGLLGDRMMDGNHTYIEGRWFLRNSSDRIRTKDEFVQRTFDWLLQRQVLPLLRDSGAHVDRAMAAIADIAPDLQDYAGAGCAADSFFVDWLLPEHVTDLAPMQNQYLRYLSPYYHREYVDLVARMSPRDRWKQRPQQLVIERFAPQLLRLQRSYGDVLSWRSSNPYLLRVPAALERLYRIAGLPRVPALYHRLSRHAISVRYDLTSEHFERLLQPDPVLFDLGQLPDSFRVPGPVSLSEHAHIGLLRYVIRDATWHVPSPGA